jgi:hypothetical protein
MVIGNLRAPDYFFIELFGSKEKIVYLCSEETKNYGRQAEFK